MKKLYLLTLLSVIGLTWTSCANDSLDELPETQAESSTRSVVMDSPDLTVMVDSVVGNTVYVSGKIDLSRYPAETIDRKGVVYGLNDNPMIGGEGCIYRISDNKLTKEEDSIARSFNVTTRDTYTHFRTYIITDTDTIYSKEDSVLIETKYPMIETLPVKNRVRVSAIALGRFIQRGDANVKSYGVCLNQTGYPTLDDIFLAAKDTAVDKTYRGRFGVWFDNLKPQTMYHIRSYCIYTLNNETDTIYGNDRIFKTTAGGDVVWQWNWQGDATQAQIDRIAEAMDSACYYYNNYSNLYHRIRVTYSAGVPTAQCNIIGDMSYGAVERYQWVGTAQHEMAHAMGVGTADNWDSFASPWDKEIAVMTLRVVMRNMTEEIKHDTQHFWPGGINQKEEVTNGTTNSKGNYTLRNAEMLKANAMILSAMREDGLYASGWYYY